MAIEKAIYTEPNLRDELIALNQSITDIENYSIEPNDRIIENILQELRHESDMHTV